MLGPDGGKIPEPPSRVSQPGRWHSCGPGRGRGVEETEPGCWEVITGLRSNCRIRATQDAPWGWSASVQPTRPDQPASPPIAPPFGSPTGRHKAQGVWGIGQFAGVGEYSLPFHRSTELSLPSVLCSIAPAEFLTTAPERTLRFASTSRIYSPSDPLTACRPRV